MNEPKRRQQEESKDGEKGRQRAWEGEMEEERGGTKLKREGERQRAAEAGSGGEDIWASWMIVTSIDHISHCLFAHHPSLALSPHITLKRPVSLSRSLSLSTHLITWHTARCYRLIRATGPFPSTSSTYTFIEHKCTRDTHSRSTDLRPESNALWCFRKRIK